MAKVKEIVDYLLSKYPLTLASSFDQGKVGLQFGSPNATVKKVLICLDATSVVVEEAIENNCDMIISHHPFMFAPLLNLNYESTNGRKMMNVFKNDLNIFAMHTNFDAATTGMNDLLCQILDLNNIHSALPEDTCDVFIRYGSTKKQTLKEFALFVKEKFKEPAIRVVGDLNKEIENIGILGGSGGNYWGEAKRNGADVLITGEIRQNNAIDAIDNDVAMIEVPHSIEANYKSFVLKDLANTFKDVEFVLATKDTNPFNVL